MAKRRKYSAEYKREAVALAQSSEQPVSQVARDLGIKPNMLSLAGPGTISACWNGSRLSMRTVMVSWAVRGFMTNCVMPVRPAAGTGSPG